MRGLRGLPSFLSKVAADVLRCLEEGYYDIHTQARRRPRPNLRSTAKERTIAIIAEIKPRSPTVGTLVERPDLALAAQLEAAGAAGISILAEKTNFGGSLELVRQASDTLNVPILFKDFVVSPKQLDAAHMCGADLVLLIAELFSDGLTQMTLGDAIGYAHSLGLEVLLELHDESLLPTVLSSEADYIGVNNRNLRTLDLVSHHFQSVSGSLDGVFKVAESGYAQCSQIQRDRRAGADAFLVGSSLMVSGDPAKKLRELIHCGQG